uniref:Uncharacterized protein n=1 Tax=Hyaloperonospora arabidopsidis (strain Emoy2) TaxID=559515 RepID=M4BW75_HYAAE
MIVVSHQLTYGAERTGGRFFCRQVDMLSQGDQKNLAAAVTEAASCVQNLHKSIKKSLFVAKDSTVAEVLHRELNEEKNYLPEKFDRLANPIREIEILRTGAERTLCLELRYAGK